jgi:hypothetical protein
MVAAGDEIEFVDEVSVKAGGVEVQQQLDGGNDEDEAGGENDGSHGDFGNYGSVRRGRGIHGELGWRG